MLTCKAAVKSMIQQQGGAIVNIGKLLVYSSGILCEQVF